MRISTQTQLIRWRMRNTLFLFVHGGHQTVLCLSSGSFLDDSLACDPSRSGEVPFFPCYSSVFEYRLLFCGLVASVGSILRSLLPSQCSLGILAAHVLATWAVVFRYSGLVLALCISVLPP